MQRTEKWTDFIYYHKQLTVHLMVYEAHSRNSDSQLLFISLSTTCSMPCSIPEQQFNSPPPILEMLSMIDSFFWLKNHIASYRYPLHKTAAANHGWQQDIAQTERRTQTRERPWIRVGCTYNVVSVAFWSYWIHCRCSRCVLLCRLFNG